MREAVRSGPLWRRFERVAEARGPEPALIQGERTVSFAALRILATGTAARLIRDGVRPGDRCLIWAGNSPDLAAAMLAVWLVGAIVAIVNDEAPVSHVLHAAATTEAVLAIVQTDLVERLADSLPCPLLLLEDRRSASPGAPVALALADDNQPASIFFTSGSSGAPKGVTQSHANLYAGCRMVAAHLALQAEDRILCPVPWAFDYGYGQFLTTILLGITQVLPTAPNPFALCEAIDRHRPTIFAALPAILALLVRGVSPIRQTDVTCIRLITVTGGPVSKAILEDTASVFAHSAIALNYGMTETYRSAGLPAALTRERSDSVGFAYPGVSLAVLRPSGQEAEPDEVGEIVHRGVGVFLGYWGNGAATAAVRRPDPLWQHPSLPPPMAVFTGDLGHKDAAGFLIIKGRRDRLIKSMGVRISPDEVETLFRNTGLVRDVVVVGLKHEIMGEMVVAAVLPVESRPDPIPALKAFARQAMSRAMQPRRYQLMDDLPLTPNGKTDFRTIAARLALPDRGGQD